MCVYEMARINKAPRCKAPHKKTRDFDIKTETQKSLFVFCELDMSILERSFEARK